jgi:CRISPR-associated protein Cas5t
MKSQLCLFVEAPICAFRPYESREYQDTDPFPPPSAVYGMLLSLCGVGREDKERHRGVAVALAMEGLPERSKVFRKLRRGGELDRIRPDYQDLLVGLRLWIWLKPGNDASSPSLVQTVESAIQDPGSVERYGGLSLGESSFLVNEINIREPQQRDLNFLQPDSAGFFNLSVWVDHARNLRKRSRFNIASLPVSDGLETCWIEVG